MRNINNTFTPQEIQSSTFKDYVLLIRNNFVTFFIILGVCTIAAVIYTLRLPDIYSSHTTIKVAKTGGNILQTPLMEDMNDLVGDRFIANELEILKSNDLRERVAMAITDSIKNADDKNEFVLLYTAPAGSSEKRIKSIPQITGMLGGIVDVEQKKGLDVILISAESQSPTEAALIASLYAKIYRTYNLEVNRDQLTYIRNFLDRQRSEKKDQLRDAEDTLRSFQEKGGIIELDEQAKTLIAQLSEFESKLSAAKIELLGTSKVLEKYKQELDKQDPRLSDYLESVTSETYIKALQTQISELQLNKDLALAKFESGFDISQKVKEYDAKITELKGKLDDKIKVLKSGIFASSPDEVRDLSQKIIETEVKNQQLQSTIEGLSTVLARYEGKFNKLPKTTIEYARFQRTRESSEKLYTLIEEKYQEALINEESQPGNVLIIDSARIPGGPSKPNRTLMILVGILGGFVLAFGFIFTKNYFDNTIKTPEDIEKKNSYVLAWIPKVEELNGKGDGGNDFIIERFPSSIASESIRALRTRVQFSKMHKDSIKTILITSPAPQEGKTTIALNLAGSFAHSNRKTLLLDADLRRPRIHQEIGKDKEPGLVNYLFGEVPLEKIINPTITKNLYAVTSGTIVGNPSEILESPEMEDFLLRMKSSFDYIIVDSPPIVAVTDAEILSRKVDGTILVVSSSKTEIDLLERGLLLVKNENSHFIGTVLNNFTNKPGYGSYYKYYYYYSPEGEKKYRKRSKKR